MFGAIMKKIIFLFLILFSFAFAEGLDFSDVEGVDAPITTAIMDDVLDNCGTVIELNESTELEDDYTDTCFVINDEDITIDCEGNTIQGSGNDDGQVAFYANNMDGITIQNCKIKDIQYGIVLHDVDESTITDNDVGIVIVRSWFDSISFNNIMDSTTGIDFVSLLSIGYYPLNYWGSSITGPIFKSNKLFSLVPWSPIRISEAP